VKRSHLLKTLVIILVVLFVVAPLAYYFVFPYIMVGERSLRDEIDSYTSASYGIIKSPYFQATQWVLNQIYQLNPGLAEQLSVLLLGGNYSPPSTTQYIRIQIVVSCENHKWLDGYTVHEEKVVNFWGDKRYENYYTYYNETSINPAYEDILAGWQIVNSLPAGAEQLLDTVWVVNRSQAIHSNPTKENWFTWVPVELNVEIQNASNPDINWLVFKDRFPCRLGVHTFYYYVMFDNSTFDPNLYSIYLRVQGWRHKTYWQRCDYYVKGSLMWQWATWDSGSYYLNCYYNVEENLGSIYERVVVMA